MHIEVGIIDPVRIALANAAALAVVASQVPALIKNPLNIPKTALAAVGFSAMMQIWHLPVGPSELHLIGATTIYMLFGFAPAMLGFALGLVLQVFLFEPGDIPHLGVNALSLMIPMIAVHYSFGRRLFDANVRDRFSLGKVLRIDAVYYAGVSTMVGFWLMISNDSFAVADWATWVAAYFPVFVVEAFITFATVTLIKGIRSNGIVAKMTEVNRLTFA
ncbi:MULTISPECIES: energy-coupling factor ABC transporter permease [Alphaproteobacteria]|uniref:Cobalt transporter CbiM n=2 Tax=Alphaproteobacteria TaxID=28211 RepID=A0A512HNB4_9HYPH|nr:MULTISPECIES: energy-coupling factor ABC transporter permease [Alphaproteobacteria]GEO86890.1 cobalt transporter CbiM [Ciceribacter naphthalenivorans]GLR22204.1 cobalt transporter CbiM [Ciceribacter naphthalenivorans]GLT05060.1 cobalt transporter CbiM [Sphingomonas psychrolutea]